jgi:hypothetical protein
MEQPAVRGRMNCLPMIMRIEQDQDQVRHSFQFQVNAEILNIRLMDATVRRSAFSLSELGEYLSTRISFKSGAWKRSATGITFGVKFRFRILSGDAEDASELAVISCHFEADYELNEGFEPDEPQIKAFHEGNAVFNCWPYFRELVQSAIARTGLPPPAVPFLRLIPKSPPAPSENDATKAAGAADAGTPLKRSARRRKTV